MFAESFQSPSCSQERDQAWSETPVFTNALSGRLKIRRRRRLPYPNQCHGGRVGAEGRVVDWSRASNTRTTLALA